MPLQIVGFGKKLFLMMLAKLKNGLVWRLRHLYTQGLYRLTYLHRKRLSATVFVGVTGSAGKTTTKDLIASILARHLSKGSKNPGSLNYPEDIVRVLLSTKKSDAYCVTEISAHGGPGMMALPLALVRPTIGVVTNIGSDHFSLFKSRAAIAQEKASLIRALPQDGVAILNADDPMVLAMRSQFSGRCITFGLTADAMLRGDVIDSAWPERLSFTATWNGASALVQTQLCGTHWMPAVLAALATGVALGVPLAVAAEAVASVEPFEGRMAPVIVEGITFIRDDWKAPLSTIAPAFDFMRQANAVRKVIVIGTISDYQGDSTRRYVEIGQSALQIADCVVFVGPRASASLRAKRDSNDELHSFPAMRDAAHYLSAYLRSGDLVLLKGSHKADHMQRLIIARITALQCWRMDCGRMSSCETCQFRLVPSGPAASSEAETRCAVVDELMPVSRSASEIVRSTVFVIGLGNPQARLVDTPHNVGYRAVEILAQRMGQDWLLDGELAMVARGELQGVPLCLIKPLSPMNEIGPALARLARDFGFDARQCILVHDDVDLPFGVVRARLRGGDGGHRGVRSILQAFQDDQFRRVKIGVGQAGEGQSVIDFVLTPFPAEMHAAVTSCNHSAADRIVELIRQSRSFLVDQQVLPRVE